MAIDHTKLIFSVGFTFGAAVVSMLNYLTFRNPSWPRGPDGTLSAHGPTFSGFPFAMYVDGHLFSMFLPNGVVGNVLFGLAFSLVFGWIAIRIPGRHAPLK